MTPEEYNAQLTALQQRRAIANAMLTQSMTAGKDWGNDRYRHSPWEAVANLGATYLNKQSADRADTQVQDATKARQAEIAQAMGQYDASTPDAQVGSQALENLRAAPADQLPQTVTPRSSALRKLAGTAMGPDQIAQATVTQAMTPEKLTEAAPGASLYSQRLGKAVYTAPEKPDKDFVDFIDAGDVRNPVSHLTGKPVAGLNPMKKGMTPSGAAADARRTPGVSLSDDAIDLAARRLLNGEESGKVLANFGRGNQGSANITAVQNRFAKLASDSGLDAETIATKTQELGAEKRARLELGAREGKIAPRVQEADNFAKLALDASAKVPRGNWTDYTGALQWGAKHSSDPALGAFQVANNSLINAYAAAVGGGVMHVHDQQKAAEMLATTDGPAAYEAKVQQLMKETHEALAAPGQVMKSMSLKGDTPKPGVPDDIAALLKKHGGK